MDYLDCLEMLLFDINKGFLVKLRLNSILSIDYKQVDEIKKTLTRLSTKWKKSNSVPKRACNMFVDFYPAMESIAAQYNKRDSDKIMLIADELMELIRDCYS